MQNQLNPSTLEIVQDAFQKIASAPQIGSASLMIWGGEFDAPNLLGFIAFFKPVLQNDMPWSMVETVSDFVVRRDADIAKQVAHDQGESLERARIFGPRGDLELRRNGEKFTWRYLGEPDTPRLIPSPEFSIQDFWSENPNITFRAVEETYFQWMPGEKRVSDHWVAPSSLVPHTRRLRQRQYLQNGIVALVRYLEFTGGEASESPVSEDEEGQP